MNLELEKNNYIFVPNFIAADKAQQLANEFKIYASSHNLPGDHQVENSHSLYNFRPFLKLVCEKVEEVSQLSGCEALPICSYSRVYRHGNILKRHKDREGCEISLTVNLFKDHSWPIGVQRPDGQDITVELNPGDAIMYRGFHADHWRDAYQGQEYIQVFMHYVDSKGPFSKEHREFINWIRREIL